MWNRTVTVGSAGSEFLFWLQTDSHCQSNTESFAATGWRVGWLIGPSSIIQPTLAASTRIIFCTNSPLQEATAVGLEQAKRYNFFETQLTEYAERRSILTCGFDMLGFNYIYPEGGYFLLLVCASEVNMTRLLIFSTRTFHASDCLMTIPFPTMWKEEEEIFGMNFPLIWIFDMKMS